MYCGTSTPPPTAVLTSSTDYLTDTTKTKRRNSETQLHRKRPYKALSHSPPTFLISSRCSKDPQVHAEQTKKGRNSPPAYRQSRHQLSPPHVNGLRQPLISVSQACCVGVFPAHRGTRQQRRRHPPLPLRPAAAPSSSSSGSSPFPRRRRIHDASRPQHAHPPHRVSRVLRLPAPRALPALAPRQPCRRQCQPRHSHGVGPLHHGPLGLGVPCVCGRDGRLHVGHRDVSA